MTRRGIIWNGNANHEEGKMRVQKLTYLEADVVDKMRSMIHCQKPEVIQNHFGIGLNTWVKLREGKAIRNSVATRLLQRLQKDQLI